MAGQGASPPTPTVPCVSTTMPLLQTSLPCSVSSCHLLHLLQGFTPAGCNVSALITPSSLLSFGGCVPVSSRRSLSLCPGLAAAVLSGLPCVGLGSPKSRAVPGLGVPCQALGPTPTWTPPFHVWAAPLGVAWEHWAPDASSCHGAVLASVIATPGSSSSLGLKAHSTLVWGTLIAPVGTTRLAVEVAACPYMQGCVQASWVANDLHPWSCALGICGHGGGWRPQWCCSFCFAADEQCR